MNGNNIYLRQAFFTLIVEVSRETAKLVFKELLQMKQNICLIISNKENILSLSFSYFHFLIWFLIRSYSDEGKKPRCALEGTATQVNSITIVADSKCEDYLKLLHCSTIESWFGRTLKIT